MERNRQPITANGMTAQAGVSFTRLSAARASADLEQDAIAGFAARPKSLPPKYFYDAEGSMLFEQICATPEYYPTRAEEGLLACYGRDIIGAVWPRVIVELGSGSSQKTRRLFDACEALRLPVLYQPLDVCSEALRRAAGHLADCYPWLQIDALIGDYVADLGMIPPVEGPRLFVFLGGTLGNFTDEEAMDFLSRLRAGMCPDDCLLVGFDRVKDAAVLDAAYNDAGGLTAAFNLNVLKVLNRHLDADFNRDDFRHRAFFSRHKRRIEMHLVARRAQQAHLRRIGLTVDFAAGESILTEISRKFTRDDIDGLLGRAGFAAVRHDETQNGYYSLVLAAPASRSQ
ncbi:MAG: L-histidine N(alpha)-methyltransferase [Gammaproteobacteria bacterium]|nr:L-histidine N(alpha)-methyltransferase [Gammaproteobacteria bacterium]